MQQVFNALTEFLKQISEVSGIPQVQYYYHGYRLGNRILSCYRVQIGSEEEFEERVNFIPMIDALVFHTGSDDKFTRETAMEWLSKFIKLGANKMIVVLDKLIAAVLRCLSTSTVREFAVVDPLSQQSGETPVLSDGFPLFVYMCTCMCVCRRT